MRHVVAAMACAAIGQVACSKASPSPAASVNAADVAADPQVALAILAALPADPVGLPQGQTLGDALPPLPPLPRRVGPLPGSQGAAGAASGCTAGMPKHAVLIERLSLDLAQTGAGAAAPQLVVCLLQLSTVRADRAGNSGRRFRAVAVWPDGNRVVQDLHELARVPLTLPPERAESGHDGSAWGGLVATGDPRRPVMAITSGRFLDGPLGEEVHLLRRAAVLGRRAGSWSWQTVGERASMAFDLPHLRALCKGEATASPADRAGGAVAAACKQATAVETGLRQAAAKRLETRQARLNGQSGGDAAKDPDPQSIWLRDGRAALAASNPEKAIQLAMQIDMVCGDAVREAHALLAEALKLAGVTRQPVKPAQGTQPLCEPLPDRPASKRARTEGPPKTGP